MDGKQTPTPREMGIIRLLWKLGPSTVRQIHEASLRQPGAKQVGYTTSLKFMQIMLDKGLLTREVDNGIHIYRPTISEQDNVRAVLDDLIHRAFEGSRMGLVMQILGGGKTSKSELKNIRKFLNELDKEAEA